MTSALVPFLAIAALAVATGASGAAAPTPPAMVIDASRGFTLRAPDIGGNGAGMVVRGDVCRRSQTAIRPVAIRLERLDAAGAVVTSQTAPLSGALSRRSPGCAFYSVRTDWRAAAGDTLRITSLTAPELAR